MTCGEANDDAARILHAAAHSQSLVGFLPGALDVVLHGTGASSGALAVAEAGQWRFLPDRPGWIQAPPQDLLADALDSGEPCSRAGWLAIPLGRRADSREVLALQGGNAERARSMTAAFQAALDIVRERESAARRIERLEAMLAIAGSWNELGDVEPLLIQFAEAATRLLRADRASIFLWDRSNRTLVGRPALGLPENELRIPDDLGVVGQVVRSGESRRVHSVLDQREINRNIDRSTGYETRTLVCVPLRSRRGEVFGAFEAMNKLSGTFSEEDERALEELAEQAARAIEATQQLEQLLSARRTIVEEAARRVQLVGASAAMEKLRATVQRVATTDLAVLILGENGTGKEVVAQSIHYQSRRRAQPFIAVNCAAIAETLLESELFGHEQGAFTDARETRIGKFELANGGTLFLDEIGDLSAAGQAKLLRVLEEKVVVRVGGAKPIHTDARVLAATNQNLEQLVRDKRFRQDLYFRLNVVSLSLPPLRDRGDDVLQLADYFLAHFSRQAKRKPMKLSAGAKSRLSRHLWPGNVRELRNLMERAAYLSASETVDGDELAIVGGADSGLALGVSPNQLLSQATDEFQIAYIKQAIASARGNMSVAAGRLGLHRSNLYRKMRQLGMETREDS
jgi:Nif-specific regulatory protein